MPGEEIDLELVYSAPKAGEFKFQIILQTLRGYRASIECRAVGVHPPLRLSKAEVEKNLNRLKRIKFLCHCFHG